MRPEISEMRLFSLEDILVLFSSLAASPALKPTNGYLYLAWLSIVVWCTVGGYSILHNRDMLEFAIVFAGQEVDILHNIDMYNGGNSLSDQRRLNACATQRSWKDM